MENKNFKLKAVLLSTCIVSASLNAITGMVPEMVKAFPGLPLATIELVTTIPSLFQMVGILLGKFLSGKIGHKFTMIVGLLFCAAGGVLPVFFPNFTLILVTRCLFGTGAGLLMSSILALIIFFFSGEVQSTMIGLNGGISGIGSALATFLAGQLLVFGWNKAFCVYFIGFAVALLFYFVVPKVKIEEKKSAFSSEDVKAILSPGLIGLGVLMFVSVLMATFYVIKASTLITEEGFGNAADGSLAITFLSLGSFAAGLTYGKIRAKLGLFSLAVFYVICLIGNVIAFFAAETVTVWIGAFLLGYGYLGFMPFIQDETARRYRKLGDGATNLILVFQSLGAFFTPYICPLFGIVSQDLKVQFLLVAVSFGLLGAIGVIYSLRNKTA